MLLKEKGREKKNKCDRKKSVSILIHFPFKSIDVNSEIFESFVPSIINLSKEKEKERDPKKDISIYIFHMFERLHLENIEAT